MENFIRQSLIFENYIKVSKSEQADRIAAKYMKAKQERMNGRTNA